MIGVGQDDDIIKLQNEINDINSKMEQHHKQHSTGIIISGVGAVSTAALVSLAPTALNPVYLIITSSIIFLGQIILLDSHKWFKKNPKKTKNITIEVNGKEEEIKTID